MSSLNKNATEITQQFRPLIVQAHKEHALLLATIGAQTFVESHGDSASGDIIQEYVATKFSEISMVEERGDDNNLYHIIFVSDTAAGYSKIVLDEGHSNLPFKNVTKLERLYVLKDFYNLNIGKALFDFNINPSKSYGQQGMWLFCVEEESTSNPFL